MSVHSTIVWSVIVTLFMSFVKSRSRTVTSPESGIAPVSPSVTAGLDTTAPDHSARRSRAITRSRLASALRWMLSPRLYRRRSE